MPPILHGRILTRKEPDFGWNAYFGPVLLVGAIYFALTSERMYAKYDRIEALRDPAAVTIVNGAITAVQPRGTWGRGVDYSYDGRNESFKGRPLLAGLYWMKKGPAKIRVSTANRALSLPESLVPAALNQSSHLKNRGRMGMMMAIVLFLIGGWQSRRFLKLV